MTERDELITYIWDEYKVVHGIRPRFCNFDELSLEQLIEWADELYKSPAIDEREYL